MAKLGIDFSQIAPDPGRGDPLPPDWYNVALEKSEEKPTKDGLGSYLECVFGVLDGQFKGRKLWFRFNLRNNNPQTVEIAYKQMSALCHAVGVLAPQDSSELHNRPLKVRVKIVPASAEYEAGNDITAFKNINEQVAKAPAAAGGGFTPPPGLTPPPAGQAPAGWGPSPVQQPTQQFAPPPMQPQQPQYQPQPQQQFAPPPVQQPQYQQPVQQPMQPQQPQGGPPAWQPPAGAVQQPWQQPQQPQAPQQPQQPQQPSQAAGMPPAFTPPPANVPQQGGAVVPPWMTPPQG